MSVRPSRRQPVKECPKETKFSPLAFYLMMTATIVLAIVVIILLILYFRRNSSLIEVANCPENVKGLVAQPNTEISSLASSCGNVANCTYTVASLIAAEDICRNLGPTKCAAFSMQQQPASNNFTLTISSSTTTNVQSGSDTYRIIN